MHSPMYCTIRVQNAKRYKTSWHCPWQEIQWVKTHMLPVISQQNQKVDSVQINKKNNINLSLESRIVTVQPIRRKIIPCTSTQIGIYLSSVHLSRYNAPMLMKVMPRIHRTAIAKHTPTVNRSGLQHSLFPAIGADVQRLLMESASRNNT